MGAPGREAGRLGRRRRSIRGGGGARQEPLPCRSRGGAVSSFADCPRGGRRLFPFQTKAPGRGLARFRFPAAQSLHRVSGRPAGKARISKTKGPPVVS